MFALLGVVAAATCWRVLDPAAGGPETRRGWPPMSGLFTARSAPLLVVAVGISITAGAYFAYAPETVQAAGLDRWIGPAMWATLGVSGAAVGAFGGSIATRFGLRGPLAAMLLVLAASTLLLLVAPGSPLAALGSAGLFGVGFTTGFALLVIRNQQVFAARPTTGFTVAIAFMAAGFSVGPALFGVLATALSRSTALLVTAAPALLATLVPPAREDQRAPLAP